MYLDLISIYLMISIIVTTFFSAFIQARGKGDYAGVILVLSLAIDCYMFGYVAELNSVSLEQKLFWNYFQYLGIPFISALWLTVGLLYTNHMKPYRGIKLFIIYSVPVATFFLRFTNEMHHLYFTAYHLSDYGPLTLLVKNGGIWYAVQGYHSAVMILIALVIYVTAFIKSRDLSSEKVIYMLGASAIACIGLLVTRSETGIDYTVLCLPVAMLFVLMAIFRNDFLEITMLARELVFENNEDGIIVINRKLKILDFNKAAEALLKEQQIRLEKKPLDSVIPRDHPLNELLRTSITNTWKSDDTAGARYYEITTTNVLQKSGTIYGKIKTFRDMTDVQLRTNRLKVQATMDELSGLYNRRAFMNACQAILNSNLEEDIPFFLLMFDLDYFKKINDTFGHAAGDYMIETFGRLLLEKFPAPALAGRLGGEEFAVLIKAEDTAMILEQAEQFRKGIASRLYPYKTRSLKLTVSIGIAKWQKTDSISYLINQADKALYISKNTGRNKFSLYERK